MKRKLIFICISLFASFSAFAQSETTGNHLLMKNIFRLDGSFEQWDDNGNRERTVSPSNSLLYTILDGDLSDNIYVYGSFHWLNSSFKDLYNSTGSCGVSNWLDILTFTYSFKNNMYITVGKDFLAAGGFEQDPSSSLVYYDVASNNWNMMPVYMYGGRIGYRFGEDGCQDGFVQIIESPFKDRIFENGLVTATLGWNGWVIPDVWKTMYSATLMQTGDCHEKDIYMLSLGNQWTAGDFCFTLDLMPRGYGLNNFFNQEFTSVTDIRYSSKKTDIFFKGGWEFCHNDENMFGSNDPLASWNMGGSICADHIYKDKDYIFGALGVEYFPLKDRNLRLSLLATTNNYCVGGGAIVASIRYCLDTFLY